MTKMLIINLDGGIGASFPDDPVKGRFHLRGTVMSGAPNAALGRKVEIQMTRAELESVVNLGSSYLLRNPKCGSTPERNEDG
jgi:hypothetical protein